MTSRPLVILACVVALAGCAEPRTPTRTPSAEPPRAEAAQEVARVEVAQWPELVAGAGDARLHATADSTRGFAWVAAGTPMRPRGEVIDGRVRATVSGPLRVRGWAHVHALGGMVLERGRLGGAPVYLVPGDEVRLVAVRGDRALVEASAYLAHPTLARSPQFRGSFPLARLGAEPAGGGAGPTPGGSPIVLPAGTALLDRPGGTTVWTVPALDPPLTAVVLRDEGEHLGVRIGAGPFLVGFVARGGLAGGARKQGIDDEVLDPWANRPTQSVPPATRVPEGWDTSSDGPLMPESWRRPEEVPPPPAEAPESAPEPEDDAVPAGLPPRLAAAARRALFHVRVGTRVRVDGATVAIFDAPGVAVELEREGDEVEVVAGVDETVTVRGMVRASDLAPMSAPTGP